MKNPQIKTKLYKHILLMNNKQKIIKIVNDLQLDMHGQLYLGSIGTIAKSSHLCEHPCVNTNKYILT